LDFYRISVWQYKFRRLALLFSHGFASSLENYYALGKGEIKIETSVIDALPREMQEHISGEVDGMKLSGP
jgi:hypothetical protein